MEGYVIPQELYRNYLVAKEISLRYGVDFSEVLPWFLTAQKFDVNLLYTFETQLRTAINSRDWNNANLILYRITNIIEQTLISKNMPEKIDEPVDDDKNPDLKSNK